MLAKRTPLDSVSNLAITEELSEEPEKLRLGKNDSEISIFEVISYILF